jgi:2-polyprenyl-3-methyl-5-hydroxy-6-metoxy-1,4-benzoquinol methylase
MDDIKYCSDSYWDDRYSKTTQSYDWYISPSILIKLFDNIIDINHKILHIGCGNSLLSEELYNIGYNNNNIYNLDISRTIIHKQSEKYIDYKMKWICQNIVESSNLKKNVFDIIIDKATLDSIACNNYKLVSKAFKYIIKILKVGGIFILVSINQDILNNCEIDLIDIVDVKNTLHKSKYIYIYILQKK